MKYGSDGVCEVAITGDERVDLCRASQRQQVLVIGVSSMTYDPWAEPDPQPGDFDADLVTIDSRYIETHVGDPEVKLAIVLAEDEDAEGRYRFKG